MASWVNKGSTIRDGLHSVLLQKMYCTQKVFKIVLAFVFCPIVSYLSDTMSCFAVFWANGELLWPIFVLSPWLASILCYWHCRDHHVSWQASQSYSETDPDLWLWWAIVGAALSLWWATVRSCWADAHSRNWEILISTLFLHRHIYWGLSFK